MNLTITKQYQLLLGFIAAVLLPLAGYSQTSITAGTPVTQNFDGMSSTSSTAALPANWKVSKSATERDVSTTSYAGAGTATERIGGANISGSASNGIYNYGNSTTTTDRAVGGLSSSSASKTVNIYTYLKNNGAGTSAISSFTISYDVEKYRAGQNADHQIQLYYSTDGVNFTSAGSAFKTSFPADGANAGYATAPGATASVTNQTLTLPSNLASGGDIYFLWSYSVGTGNVTSNAQGLGVDNISITGNSATVTNPVPVTTSISPNSATEGGAGFTLTVNGTDFINGSVVNFNGSAKTTTYVSATQLTAAIPASDIATAGTASVTVTNPAGGGGGGGTSNSQTFTINPNVTGHPLPVLTSISPSSATAGGAAFTLTATGTDFVSSSVINFNGVAKTTTYVNATTLTATVSAAEIASAGSFPVTVSSPTTGGGGGTSSAQTFTVNAAPVTYLSIMPGMTTTQTFAIGATATASLPLGWFVSKDAGTVRTVAPFSSAVKNTEVAGGNSMSTSAGNGIYNYGAGVATSASDRAIGGLSSTTLSKNVNVIAYLQNTGTGPIASFTIGYDVEKYRNGTNSAGFRIQLFYSTDGTTWTDAGANFLTTFAADADNAGFASAPGTTVSVTNKPLNVILAAGNSLYLAWNYSVASGSTTSNAQGLAVDNITITANGPNPLPAITTLTPNATTVGSLDFTLTVTGSNFVSGSEVNFNGVARPTTYVSATELTAVIPASDVAVAGSYPVTVSSPTTGGGGGTSNSLTFTVNAASAPVINVSPASLTAFSTTLGTATAGKSYQVSGAGLTGNITVTAPAGFQVSLASGSGYASSLTINHTGGNVPATTVYARFNPSVSGASSGNITHASTGATTKNVAVSGNALNTQPTTQPAITFTNLTATSVKVLLSGGNGNRRLLVVRQGSAVNSNPVDGTTYTANTLFGSGTQIGTGNYVVSAGSGNSVIVTGLSGNTTYHFSVFSFNDDGRPTGENYLTTSPGTGNITTNLASPVTYTWNVSSGNWNTAASWSPNRTTPQTNDILVFDGNVTPTPTINVDFSATSQTVGQLKFINDVTALLRVSANKTINLDNNVSGADLFVQANSQLVVTNSVLNTALTIQITGGETGQVYGDVSFTGMAGTNAAAHRLQAVDANSLVFEVNSVFTAGDKFSGNAFGAGTGNSGPLSVWFKNGSMYIQRAGSNPFGGSGATTVTTFASRSYYLVSPATGSASISPSLSGRTYGNLEIDDINFASPLSGSGALVVNDLIITAVNTFSLGLTNTVTITGNLTVEQGTVNLNTTQVIFGGTSPQVIGGAGGTLTTGNTTTMVVNAGSNVSLERDMTINGPLTVQGTFTSLDTVTVAFGGSAVRTIGGTGAVTLGNMSVGSAGVQLNNDLTVKRFLTLAGNLTTNGNTFTLQSDAFNTAMVVNDPGVVIGTATVQRYVTPNPNGPATSYHHYASPVASTTVSDLGTANFAPVVNPAYNTAPVPGLVRPFPTVFAFQESRLATFDTVAGGSGFTGAFVSPNSLSDVLTPGRGYSVLKNRSTVDLNGTLNDGTVSVGTLTYSGPTVGGNAGWHLLGNPYPSPIDWDNVTIPAGMDNAVYVYQADSRYYGTYRAYVKGGPQPVGYSALTAGIIPMMQGFYVRVNAPTSFAFENAHRVTSYENPVFYRTGAEERPVIQLDLVNSAGHADALLVYMQDGATMNADSQFDAYKIKSGEITTPNVYAITPAEEELSINGIPALKQNTVIPLGAQVGLEGEFTFKVEQLLNIPATAQVYLEDKLNGTMTPLAKGTETKVRLKAGNNSGRFVLRVAPSGKGVANVLELANVYPNPTDRGSGFLLQLNGMKGKQVTTQLYNSIGKLVESKTITAVSDLEIAGFNTANLAKGFYTLQLTEGSQTIAKKVVVN